MGISLLKNERRRPDLNRWILVLQTIALPLGYCALSMPIYYKPWQENLSTINTYYLRRL